MTVSPFEEYLEATKEKPIVSIVRHLLRYLANRFTATLLSYPWETTIILRQVQSPTIQPKSHIVIDADAERERRRREYEASLLRPNKQKTIFMANAADKDSCGYIQVDAKYDLVLDTEKSLFGCVHKVAKFEGIGSLWKGALWWNVRRIAADAIGDLIVPIIASHGGNGDGHEVLADVIVESGTAMLLNPLEVVHLRSLITSPYEQTHPAFATSLGTLFSGALLNGLARSLETFSTAALSRYGCALIDRLGLKSYGWLATGYFLVNALAVNVPLALTIPMDTIRRRAVCAAADCAATTRVCIGRDSPLRQQLSHSSSLFHGLAYRVLTNTAILVIQLLSDLEGEWLGGGDDF